LNVRCTKKGVLWPSTDGGKPIYIPPNTQVYYSAWLVHRREDLWGPTGEHRPTEICSPDVLTFPPVNEFDPDRFLDDRFKQYLAPNPSIFFPFSMGPRACLGQQFAFNGVSTVITRIAQAFERIRLDMDSNPEAKPPADWANGNGRKAKEKIWVRSHINVYAKGGVWVKMEEVDPE